MKKISSTPLKSNALIINDTRTQNNIGCRATTTALLQQLSANGITVSTTITLLELNQLWNTLSSLLDVPPSTNNFEIYVSLFDSHPYFSYYRDLISSSGRIFINGEGSIYGRQGKGLLLFILAVWSSRFQ